ncbi:queuosine tRNA-ribosyltransferase [Shewanella phage S0112]|nr:queuosine tRNA-ribosyltransferase [Shewanella phage S0112]
MRIFLAGVYSINFAQDSNLFARLTEQEKIDRMSVPWHLESYHYIHRQKHVDTIRKEKRQVFLDSGAFSSWSQGVEVDLPAYCDYIHRNKDIILHEDDAIVASVLDKIGSDQGTYENQLEMERRGVRPLPCFHYGEDPRYLEYYVANYSYITLGGMVAQSTPDLLIWLDELWEKYLTDSSGRPKTKVHAFGVTTPVLMRKYPWFSVDSSSWVQVAANGGIMINERAVPVSESSPARKVENQHYLTLSPSQQKAIDKIVESKGYTVDRLSKEYLARWVYNMRAYYDMHAGFKPYEEVSWKQDQMGLF